jgi:iron complex transport system ATP-binding protein
MNAKIAIRGGSFSYGNGEVFTDLCCDVSPGEVLCLLGANGCGKTTLLRCLSGYLKLKSGAVYLDGSDIATMHPTSLARRIGFVFQDNVATFPYSVLEVVRMGRAPHLPFFASPGPEDTKIAEHAMDNVGIAHLRDKRFTEISGGERQLAVIARTLAQEPDVIIMDEPTSALDFRNQTLVLRMISKLASQGLTIIMSSHFPNNALLFSSVVAMMHEGRLIALGSADEVVKEDNLERIYGIAVRILTATDAEGGRPVKFVVPDDDGHMSPENTPSKTGESSVPDKGSQAAPAGTHAARWDALAEDFERQFSRSDYRDKVIERIEVAMDATVLDVGSGPGTLALPLARRVKSVTALDASAGMIRVGEARAREEGISNIAFVHMDWNDVVVGEDIVPHDVVVCSRAFCGRNPEESLRKLDQAARSKVYMTLKTGGDGSQRFYEKLYLSLGMEYVVHRDYIHYYNILYELGITAKVDFITYTDSFRYEEAADAFRVLNSHISVETEDQRRLLMGYVRKNIAANGRFALDIESRWAMLSWEKKEGSWPGGRGRGSKPRSQGEPAL